MIQTIHTWADYRSQEVTINTAFIESIEEVSSHGYGRFKITMSSGEVYYTDDTVSI